MNWASPTNIISPGYFPVSWVWHLLNTATAIRQLQDDKKRLANNYLQGAFYVTNQAAFILIAAVYWYMFYRLPLSGNNVYPPAGFRHSTLVGKSHLPLLFC